MRIVIPGEPIAKARPKFSSYGSFVKTYDPQSKLAKAMKGSLGISVKLDLPNDFEDYFRLPLYVSLAYHMPIAKSDSATLRNAKLWGFEKPNHKPDLDNLIKWTADIANGILWHDDAQIVQLAASQEYSDSPCTIIEVNLIHKVNMIKEHENVFKTFSPTDLCDFINSVRSVYMRTPMLDKEDPLKLAPEELAATANVLIEFANKWSDKLRKIKGKI